jgi:hypothetical protein
MHCPDIGGEASCLPKKQRAEIRQECQCRGDEQERGRIVPPEIAVKIAAHGFDFRGAVPRIVVCRFRRTALHQFAGGVDIEEIGSDGSVAVGD